MARRALVVFVVLLALVWLKHYVQGLHTANEYVRLYATLAVAEFGGPRLDPVFDKLAPGWRKTGKPPNLDVAVVKDAAGVPHYYLDKAPLPSLLAVPAHLVIRRFVDPWARPEVEVTILAFLLCGLPLLIFLELGVPRSTPQAEAALILLALGSPLLLYGMLWFGHLTAGLVAFAGVALVKRGWGLWGGAVLGAALLCDYPAAVPVGVALALWFFTAPTWRLRLGPGLVALAVALGGQAAANAWMFGDPLVFAYAHKYAPQFQAIHGSGLMGVDWPDWRRWLALLGGPERGLLFLSPVLVLALPGAWIVARDRARPAFERALPLALLIVVPVVLAGFVDWKAGNGAGPRHLVSLLPFLAGPALIAFERLSARPGATLRVLALALGVLAVAQVWVVRATFPYLSTDLTNPVYHQALPLFADGCRYAPWLPHVARAGVLAWLAVPAGALLLALAWGTAGLAPRARALAGLVALAVGLGLLPAGARVGAGDPGQVAVAAREAAMVQGLLACKRTDTAAELVRALGGHDQGEAGR